MFTARTRSNKGSIIAFSTVLALALVVLGVGFFFILLFMGGQRETKNAIDAGVLNAGKQALDQIQVPLSGSPDQQCFFDVTNDADDGSSPNDGKVDLRRINRVWAKAMLIGINADAAQADGTVGSGEGNADLAYQGAKSISDALSQQLTTQSNLYNFFNDYAQANSVRMIGSGAQTTVIPGSGWQTSLMDRQRESNITVNSNFPSGYFMNPGNTTPQTRTPPVPSGNGLTFLKGYTPLTVAGNQIWQVPFQYDEKPRMVSQKMFDPDMNSASPLAWTSPVPNAFSGQAKAVQPNGAGENATSWVLTNPRQTFQMSMPHSFLHIHVDQPKTQWYWFPTGYPPIKFGPDQNYGFDSITSQDGDMPAGGVLCADVASTGVEDIGADIFGRNLDQIIFGPPGGNTATLETQMTNRMNEMISKTGKSYSTSDMHSVLSNGLTIAALAEGQTDFYVYSPDGVNLTVAPQLTAQVTPMWLAQMINNSPDGTETQYVDDASVPAPMFFEPTITPDPDCVEVFAAGWGTWDKSLYWQPGTGYNGCLGKVRVTRWTDIYSFGVCAVVFP